MELGYNEELEQVRKEVEAFDADHGIDWEVYLEDGVEDVEVDDPYEGMDFTGNDNED